ncbi:MAG: hypothetical protein ACI92S_002328 [Planctomycetaceae bacterium]|jgi:hypothetical protein
MVRYGTLLSWALAFTLGGVTAAVADEPVSFVVHPEAEAAVAEDATESLIDRLFNKPVVTPVVAEAYYESDCCPNSTSTKRQGGCSLAEGCAAAVGCNSDSACASEAWIRFDSEAKSILPADNPIDGLMKQALTPKD